MLSPKNTNSNFSKIFFIVSLLVVLSTVFIINDQLANGVVSGKYFWFYGSMGLLTVAALIYFLENKIIRFSFMDGFVLFFNISVLISALVLNDISITTDKLVIFTLLTILYFYVRVAFNGNMKHIQSVIIFFIIVTGLVEACWGVLQLHDFLPSQHKHFILTGSFFNPGPYAGYLAVVFPLALYVFLEKDLIIFPKKSVLLDILKFSFKWLSGLTCISIILVIPASMSRASWVAAIAGSLVVITGRLRGTDLWKRVFLHSRMKGFYQTIVNGFLSLCTFRRYHPSIAFPLRRFP